MTFNDPFLGHSPGQEQPGAAAVYHFQFHFQFALDRSHRFERLATEHRTIARADAVAPSYAAPELRVPAPISSRPIVIRDPSSQAAA
jgi:hypothetical protein